MASTVDQLRSDFEKATEKTRQAYDAWTGEFGSSNYVKKEYEKAVEKGDKAEAARLKPEYDRLSQAYKAAQEEKNRLKLALSRAERAEGKTKAGESSLKTYNKTLTELKKAESNIQGYKGNEGYIAAYQKAQIAYDEAVAAGKNPKALPAQKITVPAVEKKQEVNADGTPKTTSTETLSSILGTLSDTNNLSVLKQLQNDLKTKFPSIYKGGVDGMGSWAETQYAIQKLMEARSILPTNLQGKSFAEFVVAPGSADLIISGGGTGGVPTATATISDPTTAARYINSVVNNLLGRDATPKEVEDLRKILNDAELKNKTSTVGGITKGGIDQYQFLTDLIKTGTYKGDKKLGKLGTLGKLTESFKKKGTETGLLTAQTLAATARANGITLNPEQLAEYATQVKNGTDIKTIQNTIRNTVANTMPETVKKMMLDGTDLETIYQPYKNIMYQTLEINPETIPLNDSALASAIGPNGQMTLFDFQKTLRKDPRWQYTNNAREDVSNSVTKVLQDFGFMG